MRIREADSVSIGAASERLRERRVRAFMHVAAYAATPLIAERSEALDNLEVVSLFEKLECLWVVMAVLFIQVF